MNGTADPGLLENLPPFLAFVVALGGIIGPIVTGYLAYKLNQTRTRARLQIAEQESRVESVRNEWRMKLAEIEATRDDAKQTNGLMVRMIETISQAMSNIGESTTAQQEATKEVARLIETEKESRIQLQAAHEVLLETVRTSLTEVRAAVDESKMIATIAKDSSLAARNTVDDLNGTLTALVDSFQEVTKALRPTAGQQQKITRLLDRLEDTLPRWDALIAKQTKEQDDAASRSIS